MRRIHSLVSVFLLISSPVLPARDSPANDTVNHLCSRLEAVSRNELEAHLGGYGAVMEHRDGLAPSRLRALRFEHMRPLLQHAVETGMGILEVFTQPGFADPNGCAFFMDGATLAEIQRIFNLHGVWQIVAKVSGQPNETLRMSYLIVGRGHLIVGYPRAATITIDDDDAVTGEYDYAPYFSARIDQRERSVRDIKTLTSPDGEFGAFRGPFGIRISSMQLTGREVLVKYVWGFEQERRTRNVPISLRHLAASAH